MNYKIIKYEIIPLKGVSIVIINDSFLFRLYMLLTFYFSKNKLTCETCRTTIKFRSSNFFYKKVAYIMNFPISINNTIIKNYPPINDFGLCKECFKKLQKDKFNIQTSEILKKELNNILEKNTSNKLFLNLTKTLNKENSIVVIEDFLYQKIDIPFNKINLFNSSRHTEFYVKIYNLSDNQKYLFSEKILSEILSELWIRI